MASLGFGYLAVIAPVIMAFVAFRGYTKRKLSIYHLWTYYGGALYFLIAPLTFIILSSLGK
jgi:hypothetical protein